MQVQTYLMMDGRADEAIEFYKKTLGATVGMLMRFKEAPEGSCAPGAGDKVMHAYLTIGETGVMISDGYNKGQPKFEGFALSIETKTEAENDRLIKALAEGGEITMPASKTFFSPSFGMLKDKFGVQWMILVAQ